MYINPEGTIKHRQVTRSARSPMPPVAPAPLIIKCIKSLIIVITIPLTGPRVMLPINIGSIEKSNWINAGIKGTGISKKYRTLAMPANTAVVAIHLLLEIFLYIELSFSYPDFTVGTRIALVRRRINRFATFADYTAGEEFHLPSKNYLFVTIINLLQKVVNYYIIMIIKNMRKIVGGTELLYGQFG